MSRVYFFCAVLLCLFCSCSNRVGRAAAKKPCFQNDYVCNQIDGTAFSSMVADDSKSLIKSCRNKHVMVVFVHGTIIFPGVHRGVFKLSDYFAQRSLLFRRLSDAAQSFIRYKLLYGNQIIGDYGLRKFFIDQSASFVNTPEGASVATVFASMWKDQFGDVDANQHWYTFGWDGVLHAQNRKEAGSLLYASLLNEKGRLCSVYNITEDELSVVLIGHSHGGNVILSMADARQSMQKNNSIDLVMLFGTPIQQDTHMFARDPMFKTIINCYSYGDLVQVADIISSKKRSTRVLVASTKDLPADKRIYNVAIDLDGIKPSHYQLWCKKDRAGILYMPGLIIKPYPVLVFAPAIIQGIGDLPDQNYNLTCSIRLDNNAYKLLFFSGTDAGSEKKKPLTSIVATM